MDFWEFRIKMTNCIWKLLITVITYPTTTVWSRQTIENETTHLNFIHECYFMEEPHFKNKHISFSLRKALKPFQSGLVPFFLTESSKDAIRIFFFS